MTSAAATEPLSRKRIVVVGGGSGIGAGCAIALAAAGGRVFIGGRRREPLESVASPHEAIALHTIDVADRDSVAAFFAAATDHLGGVDIVVNCAGLNVSPRSLADVAPEDWDRLMAINTTGAFNVIKAVLPQMRERKDGLIITVSSIAGLRALELAGAGYCASKFATTALSTYGGLELADEGVRFTAIHPGEVETPILDQRPEPVSAERRATMLQPEDVAAAVVMIAALPPRAHVMELTIKPTVQRFA